MGADKSVDFIYTNIPTITIKFVVVIVNRILGIVNECASNIIKLMYS